MVATTEMTVKAAVRSGTVIVIGIESRAWISDVAELERGGGRFLLISRRGSAFALTLGVLVELES